MEFDIMFFSKNVSGFRMNMLPPSSVRILLHFGTYKGVPRWETFPCHLHWSKHRIQAKDISDLFNEYHIPCKLTA